MDEGFRGVRYTPVDNGSMLYFHDILRPALFVEYLFGQSSLAQSAVSKTLSKCLFAVIFLFTILVFILAVFGRGDGIELWIQFSLYMIPILAIPCGARALNSDSYNRLLWRRITDSYLVKFFVSSEKRESNHDWNAPAHNKEWIEGIAGKSLILPLSLDCFQIGGFLIFTKFVSMSTMVGTIHITKEISTRVWTAMYFTFWLLTMYLVGFITFQFVFISRVIVKDTVSLMSLFGDSSFLRTSPAYLYSVKRNCLYKAMRMLVNFITIDLWSTMTDEFIFSNCAYLSRNHSKSEDTSSYTIFPNRLLTNPVANTSQPVNETIHHGIEDNEICSENKEGNISPAEASEVFSTFIAEVEEMTSSFTPFTVIISFFGVANLITHVCLFVVHDTYDITMWTMFRTVLFLFIAIRLLLCVQRISSVLGKFPSHVKFLKFSGKLMKQNDENVTWDDFLELVGSFNLNKRSFGFPLTLRQVASIATFLNMACLIVFSVFKSNNKYS